MITNLWKRKLWRETFVIAQYNHITHCSVKIVIYLIKYWYCNSKYQYTAPWNPIHIIHWYFTVFIIYISCWLNHEHCMLLIKRTFVDISIRKCRQNKWYYWIFYSHAQEKLLITKQGVMLANAHYGSNLGVWMLSPNKLMYFSCSKVN